MGVCGFGGLLAAAWHSPIAPGTAGEDDTPKMWAEVQLDEMDNPASTEDSSEDTGVVAGMVPGMAEVSSPLTKAQDI